MRDEIGNSENWQSDPFLKLEYWRFGGRSSTFVLHREYSVVQRRFLVQLKSGEVVAWGDSMFGGSISAVKAQLDLGIVRVWCTSCSFLVQLNSGEVAAWGDRNRGGDISAVKVQLDQGIEQVWSTNKAFLVQLNSGEVVAWGDFMFGGDVSALKALLDHNIEHTCTAYL